MSTATLTHLERLDAESIHLENVPIVPPYYAARRPVVVRDGTLIMVEKMVFEEQLALR